MIQSQFIILTIFALSAAVSGYDVINYEKHLSDEELKQLEDGGTYEFDQYNNILYKLVDSTNCTKPGPICGSCESVFECIQVGGGFIVEQLDDCPSGSTCLISTGTCTTEHNPDCNAPIPYKFTCRQVSIFPDAFDCQRYHICVPVVNSTVVNPQSISQRCNEGFYFDPKTTLCRFKLTNETNCSVVVPPCAVAGEAGMVPNNPALYYICLRTEGSVTYSPQMFSCLDNTVYDLHAKACVDPSPINGTDSNNKCISAGNFFDSASVFFYFECANQGVSPIRRACENKMRFNPVAGECVAITWADFEW